MPFSHGKPNPIPSGEARQITEVNQRVSRPCQWRDAGVAPSWVSSVGEPIVRSCDIKWYQDIFKWYQDIKIYQVFIGSNSTFSLLSHLLTHWRPSLEGGAPGNRTKRRQTIKAINAKSTQPCVMCMWHMRQELSATKTQSRQISCSQNKVAESTWKGSEILRLTYWDIL